MFKIIHEYILQGRTVIYEEEFGSFEECIKLYYLEE